MGQLTIQLSGSFLPNDAGHFSAMEHGHAAAVMEAIYWLQSDILPKATKQDQELKEKGYFPSAGFNVLLDGRDRQCPNCAQVPDGEHSGEYPCPICGLPTVWDST